MLRICTAPLHNLDTGSRPPVVKYRCRPRRLTGRGSPPATAAPAYSPCPAPGPAAAHPIPPWQLWADFVGHFGERCIRRTMPRAFHVELDAPLWSCFSIDNRAVATFEGLHTSYLCPRRRTASPAQCYVPAQLTPKGALVGEHAEPNGPLRRYRRQLGRSVAPQGPAESAGRKFLGHWLVMHPHVLGHLAKTGWCSPPFSSGITLAWLAHG